ncbi:DUF4974 domain-containing protein [Pseudoflavitalea sp. X16]|uniref:FecR family protein n=1 Tax=Paraflavitalea devenefica TaxID=2716334 RepID=UPI0014227D54|nr:FecR domain-containing protein [Paraflavitalea devenefica]NII25286.1 DUF4974 domain-containing protein [Paraflavitalea devenefica]
MTDELMERFFKGECSAEEREWIAHYFREHPAEWDKYLAGQDWEHFTYTGKLQPARSEKMLHTIQRATYRKRAVVRTIKRVAVAAVVVLVIGLGWLYMNTSRKAEQATASEQTAAVTEISYTLQRRMNTTSKPLSMTLQDGSMVTLEPGSVLKFYEPFVKSGRRMVYLEGQAYFSVAKDSTTPFMVNSDGITTTALGTSFTIQAIEQEPVISVRLHTGKVVIKPADSLGRRMKEPVYLKPGHVLVYNKTTMLVTVKAADSKLAKAPGKAMVPNWYMFSNQPLDQVFQQLEELYGVQINYAKDALKDMYFIGRFEKTDSLETIMRDIALLNKLTLTKEGNTYTLTKQRH